MDPNGHGYAARSRSPGKPSRLANHFDCCSAAELREAFGVRGAGSRFRAHGTVRERQQAGRTPYASRGRSPGELSGLANIFDCCSAARQSVNGTRTAAWRRTDLSHGGWEDEPRRGPGRQPRRLPTPKRPLPEPVFEAGKDAFHRVPFIPAKVRDAVERVLTPLRGTPDATPTQMIVNPCVARKLGRKAMTMPLPSPRRAAHRPRAVCFSPSHFCFLLSTFCFSPVVPASLSPSVRRPWSRTRVPPCLGVASE